ncbi:ABC transporter permease [Candidatus Poribacteria bacterium]|nr:ABC transporter permease [Candidatus Poribacteria bacterium]
MKYFEYLIGLRYLRAKPAQTIMSAGGVMLGVVVVIVSLSVFNGFQTTLRDRLLGSEPYLVVLPQGGSFGDHNAFIDELRAIPKVTGATPTIMNQALLRNYDDRDRLSGALVKGIDPATISGVTDLGSYLRTGALDLERPDLIAPLQQGDSPRVPADDTIQGGIILGWALARRLQVRVGDPLFVFADFKEDPYGRIYPVPRVFVVVDLYTSGLYEMDSNMAFVSLTAAQSLYRTPTDVSQIEVRTDTPDDADTVQRAILERYGLEYLPKTWKELRGSFFGALELEKRLTFVTLALIIVVAAFSTAITLIMLVMEKTREIGALRALGAERGSVLRLFMLNGTIIGVIGAILGTVVSLGLCWLLKHYLRIPLPGEVYQVDYVPVKVSWGYVASVNALAIAVCWLASLYPAYRASRLRPVEALRYE